MIDSSSTQELADDRGTVLRRAELTDASSIAHLHGLLEASGWSESHWSQVLQQYRDAWVIEVGSHLAGFVVFQTEVPQAELLNIGVSRNHHGCGLGTELLRSTLSLLPAHVESVYLEVRRSNVPAIGLYHKMGFEKVGERQWYYPHAGGSREDALIYRLRRGH